MLISVLNRKKCPKRRKFSKKGSLNAQYGIMLFNIEEIEAIVKTILWTEPALQGVYECLWSPILRLLPHLLYKLSVLNTALYRYAPLTELRRKY
jgi:hypothetical protein